MASKRHRITTAWVLAALTFAAPAAAKDPPRNDNSPVVDNLLGCRGLSDSGARLECFDRAVAALQQARERKEIVVLDRAGVTKAKRTVFGFSLPKIRLFGGSDADEPEVTQISATLTSVREGQYGAYVFGLDDGSAWQTTESVPGPTPRSGQPITIKAGPLGSYIAKVGKAPGVKVKRLR